MSMHPGLALSPHQNGCDRINAVARRIRRDVTDSLLFFGRWLRDPAGMASIAPSSRALAALITRGIDGRMGPVLELGSGTGAFVPALLERGVAEDDLTLVERDLSLARLLTQRYPRARVLSIDASDIDDFTSGPLFGAVVCGLGLLNMRPEEVEAILSAALERMRPDAQFYLFTYGHRCSVPHDMRQRLRLDAERVGTAWRNLPPAAVFRIGRSAPSAADHPGQRH